MNRVGEVRERIDASPYGFGLVTSEGGVLLAWLRQSAWTATQPRRSRR